MRARGCEVRGGILGTGSWRLRYTQLEKDRITFRIKVVASPFVEVLNIRTSLLDKFLPLLFSGPGTSVFNIARSHEP